MNYSHLSSILASKEIDSDEIKTFEYLADSNHPMYLDGSVQVPKIAFASLMRSGNTFFRRLVENITGVATGSNICTGSSLSLGFVAGGFKAEGITDDRTWIFKTHYPYIYPSTYPASMTKSIVLVRNPFDVLVSLF